MIDNTGYSQKGDACCKTIFVFCCPGRHEDGRGPVNGPTGDNLSRTLSKLAADEFGKKYFQWGCTCDYHITNAWTNVEYLEKTQRTQPSKKEVLRENNLARLYNDLQGMKLVIACGQRARWAIQALREQKKLNSVIVETLHLSPRAINRWVSGKTIDERISRWVQCVLSEIKKKQF